MSNLKKRVKKGNYVDLTCDLLDSFLYTSNYKYFLYMIMNLNQSKSPNRNIVDLTCGSDKEGNCEMVSVASNLYFEQK